MKSINQGKLNVIKPEMAGANIDNLGISELKWRGKDELNSDDWKIKPVNPKENQSWLFIGKIDADTPNLWPPDAKSWKRPHSREKSKAKGKGDHRGWDGYITSPIQWTWIWARRQWRTEEPGMLQSLTLTKSHTQLSKWTTVIWKRG